MKIPILKKILHKIINAKYDAHEAICDLKLLNLDKKRKFWVTFRNREKNTCYYRVTLKGNYIRLYRTQYLIDGKPTNIYSSQIKLLITDDISDIYRTVVNKELMITCGLNDLDMFMDQFALLIKNDMDKET